MTKEEIDQLADRIEMVRAEPGTLFLVKVPVTTSQQQLKSISELFNHAIRGMDYRFLVVPETINVEMVPKDPRADLLVTEN